MFFYTLIALNYLSIIYMTFLWHSTQEKVPNFNLVLKEPALYNHLIKVDASISVVAILIAPFIYLLCIYLFVLLTSLIFGFYIPIGKGKYIDIYDWYIMLIMTIPILMFIYTYVRSSLLIHCTVCEGKGKLSEYNSYLERSFDKDTCFCCQGTKVIKKNSQLGKTHKLLIENLALLERKSNKLVKLEREFEKLEYELNRESDHETSNLKKLKQRVEEQKSFEEASEKFYKLTVSKLMILLYKYYMTSYVLRRNKELENLIDENVNTFVDIEMKKDDFGMDSEMVFKIESLVQEISLSEDLSTSLGLQSELEQLTQNITIEK